MEAVKATEAIQYLTFTLQEEVFAIEISKVREVLDFTTITKVPRTPDYMRGVINLRGNVVPVVDMRLKFGLPPTEDTLNTCIIIVEVKVEDETAVLGALGDSVREVIELDPENIEPPPRIGTTLNTEYLHGMGKSGDNFTMILNIDRIFSTDELVQVQDTQETGETMPVEEVKFDQEEADS